MGINKVDWSTYKFHCSMLPTLMTNGRSKGEVLSETAKGKLREIFIQETFGRRNFGSANKYTQKGLTVEQDSLNLISKVHNTGFLTKSKEQLSNEWITGTPDVEKPILRDAKSSWDIFTFSNVDEKKARSNYFWQLWGYMWLTGQKKAMLDYTLVNTPVEIKDTEIYSLTFKGLTDEELDQAELNYKFDDIPEEIRVKTFEFKFEEATQEELICKLAEARLYLSTLSL